MPEYLCKPHKASLPDSEAARVVSFDDFSLEEGFKTCVHLTTGPEPRRCRNAINKHDRQKARCVFLKIRTSTADGTSLRDSLLVLANCTLCKLVHRPNDGTEILCTRMAQKWSHDCERKQRVEETVAEEIEDEADPTRDTDMIPLECKDLQESCTIRHDQDVGPYKTMDAEKLTSEADQCGEDSEPVEPVVLVKAVGDQRKAANRSKCEPQEHEPSSGAIRNLPPQPLPRRVTRSGTFSEREEKYLPFCPYLLTLTSAQLTHHTNAALLSLVATPLKIMAKKTGCVYIFTRPDDPSLVKIGFTTHSGQARVAAWSDNCCYAASLEYCTETIPHAWLVERLVQEHLAQYRRIEVRCKWKASCATRHKEWYEISVKEAQGAVQMWADWIIKYRPWGNDHTLTPEWVSLVDTYRKALDGPGKDKEMWGSFVRMDDPRKLGSVVLSPAADDMMQEYNTETAILKASNISTLSPVQTSQVKVIRKPCHPPLDTEIPLSIINDSSPSPSSKHSQSSFPTPKPKVIRKLLPLFLNTKELKSNRCSSPPSSSPSPAQKPRTPISTTLLKQTIRHTIHQTNPETIQALVKSAFSNLDTYLAGSSSNPSSPSGKNKNKKGRNTRITIKMDRKSMSLAWGELDEGYCTA
jgi:T5orf172 domain